jgi:hypothetical protein
MDPLATLVLFVALVALVAGATLLVRLVHVVTHRPVVSFISLALLAASLIEMSLRAVPAPQADAAHLWDGGQCTSGRQATADRDHGLSSSYVAVRRSPRSRALAGLKLSEQERGGARDHY